MSNFDYNTSRKKLALPEYGRHIHKLVDYLMTIEDREERNKAAKSLINIMGNLNPHLRDVSDFKHKLWDHLFIISDFQLDIDSPYPRPTKSVLAEKPRKVPYNQHNIKFKHYGHVVEQIIKKAVEMPDGEHKRVLIEILANLMKRQYLTWNRESVTDETILKDLYELSNGKINITTDILKLSDSTSFQNKNKKKVFISKKGDNGKHRKGQYNNHQQNR